MSKTYRYYPVCFNDIRVLPHGGIFLDDACFKREATAEDNDPEALWAKVVDARRNEDVLVTGCGNTYNDPANDCTYVVWGNYTYEDLGVFKPMLPKEYDRAEHTAHGIVPPSVSSMT